MIETTDELLGVGIPEAPVGILDASALTAGPGQVPGSLGCRMMPDTGSLRLLVFMLERERVKEIINGPIRPIDPIQRC